MYALNLAENGRILSATYEKYAPSDAVLVEVLPDGDIFDYLYIDGQYVYDHLPKENAIVLAPHNIVAGEYITIDGVLYLATENIPNGEPVIVGQNAIETTVEEQLYDLKGE